MNNSHKNMRENTIYNTRNNRRKNRRKTRVKTKVSFQLLCDNIETTFKEGTFKSSQPLEAKHIATTLLFPTPSSCCLYHLHQAQMRKTEVLEDTIIYYCWSPQNTTILSLRTPRLSKSRKYSLLGPSFRRRFGFCIAMLQYQTTSTAVKQPGCSLPANSYLHVEWGLD